MTAIYPASFYDRLGIEAIEIANDGKSLSTTIRGIRLRGSAFDSLSPVDGPDSEVSPNIVLNQGSICSCKIELCMPIRVVALGQSVECPLRAEIELGDPTPKGSLDREMVRLSLPWGGTVLFSRGTSGWFEGELVDIQRQLPEGTYIKACINCSLSDYSPAGHGSFGCMACFREHKEQYLRVGTKCDLFRIWPLATEMVQETYLCPSFERRRPNTGYRG